MRRIHVILALALMSTSFLFAQKLTKEKMDVTYIQLPQFQLEGVKTYSSIWTTNVEEEVLKNWKTLGFSEKLVKGVLNLSGFEYASNEADVTLNLVSGDLSFSEPLIENIAGESEPANYRAIYRISGEWKIEITGKQQYSIDLTEVINKVEVMYPALTDTYGASRVIPSIATVDNAISANPEKIQQNVGAQLLKTLANEINAYLNEELGYLKKKSTFKLYGFKSNKKIDMSAWDEPTLKATEMLNKINAGENPENVYAEYKSVISFWDAEYEKNKDNVKENKNVLEASVRNLINTLSLINPEEIKEEYIAMLDEFIFVNDIKLKVADAKKRQAANNLSGLNFGELSNAPVLRNYFYPVSYETTKGEVKKGMIQFSTPYYLNPWETGAFVKIYTLEAYNNAEGKVNSKEALDLKSVASYTIYGDKFVQMKFTDPAVLTVGGSASFLEEMIKGSASAYKNYSMEAAETNGMVVDLSKGLSSQTEAQLAESRMNPNIVLAHGKKPIVIYSYSKLAELLFDKKDISMKIAEGKYGNDPIKVKDADKGKFSGGNNASNDIILKIIEDYNAN